MTKSKTLLTFLLFFIITISLASCGGSDSKDPVAPSTGTSTTNTGTSTTNTGTATSTSSGTITSTGGYVDGTDKWHIIFDDSQVSSMLTTLGFSASSTVEFKTYVIQYMRQYYIGQKISFSMSPPIGGNAPASGTSAAASSLVNPYNVLKLWARGGGVLNPLGSSPGDTTQNPNVDNLSGMWQGYPIGVFLDVFTNNLVQAGWNSTNATVEEIAESVAVVAAHEIGHSIGLMHSDGNHIMNAQPMMMSGPYSFSSSDIGIMQGGALPGPNR